IAELEVVELFRLLSEDLTPSHWSRIADEVAKKIESGVNGVIVAHGTDTMSYTAAALAFALRNLPCPVMLVGAQRSSDRPSTDSVLNLRACPVVAARAPFGEVTVVMHGHTSDSYVLVHRGVKVRKMHTSRRDAFQSINDVPLARIDFPERKFSLINRRYLPRSKPELFTAKTKFSEKVALIKAYPGFDCEIIDYLVDRGYEGIVIEGTGLGHIRGKCVEAIKRACEEGVIVVMTSQTLFGRVNMKVYTNGRKLILAGVIPGSDMLPEAAYAKLSWLLANVPDRNEVKILMTHNLVNEINEIHDMNAYPRWYHG
ncbi:MAG: Glu-tRNA(Gln) amidotransferase subunit GatD, partial [Desulfurococcales archaeon]|nr:Glu-tRNA(Gln) amidotransferase subunit GatD [Desulfurococcales archaeon]